MVLYGQRFRWLLAVEVVRVLGSDKPTVVEGTFLLCGRLVVRTVAESEQVI